MMKVLFSLVACLAGSWANADLTLVEEIEGGPQQGEIVMQVKEERLRLDLPGGVKGPMSTIVNLTSGDTTTLVHARKISITRPGAQAKEASHLKDKPSGLDSTKKVEPPKPTPTAMKERVGDYDAEVFTMAVDGTKDTLWVVRDFPSFNVIKTDLQRINQASTSGLNRAGTLDVTSLPGMVVKRQKERGGQKVTITLKSVSRDAIEDSIFEIPADYRAVAPRQKGSQN